MKAVLMAIGLVSMVVGNGLAAKAFVRKVDLTNHDTKGHVTIKRVKPDVVEWSLMDGKKQTLEIDLKRLGINPGDYDELRFDIKPLGSQVSLNTRLNGFPEKKDVTSWYLKFKSPVATWSEGRYDLRVDDDGIFLPRGKKEDGILELTLSRRILGIENEPQWRKALIRNLRFVKYRVKASFDLADCVINDNGKTVSYTYPLQLVNRLASSQTVVIDPDSTKRLKYFRVSSPRTLSLAANEQKTVDIVIQIDRDVAMFLPALYSERIYPKISIAGLADSDVIPLMGFRRWPMWGVVPNFNTITWTPETMRAFIDARTKVLPGIAKWQKRIIAKADKALEYDWPIPKTILPGHTMQYRISKSKCYPVPLKPTDFHNHRDPKTGKIYRNVEKLDRAYVGRYYGRLANYVYDCSLAYLLTGKKVYADKARKILLDLAEALPDMPRPGMRSTSGGVRLGCNSLLASYILPVLCEGYLFLQGAPCLTQEDHHKIKAFLKDEALMVARHSTEYTNQTAEHIRAYGTAAIATGFWPIGGEAIYGEFGWHEMVEYAFSDDGIGHEAGAYHRAIFGAMEHLASLAYMQNVNLFTARFKRVFDGSLITGVKGVSYETAYRVYRDSAYIKKLQAKRQKYCSTSCVLQGILGLPDAASVKEKSVLMPSTGYVFLRKGTVQDCMELRINYIKNYDRSEHDKFSTFMYKNGKAVDDQVGRIIYSSPHSHWMYETAAHNAIVINGGNEVDVDGELVAFSPDTETPAAVVRTVAGNGFYPGVQQVRCVALIDNIYLVFDHVMAEKPVTIDRYQQGGNKGVVTAPKASAITDKPKLLPHAAFSNFRVTQPVQKVDAFFGKKLKMRLVSDKPLNYYQVDCYAGWQAGKAETTFGRIKNTKEASFLAAFVAEKDAPLPDLKIVETTKNMLKAEVSLEDKSYSISINLPNKTISIKRSK